MAKPVDVKALAKKRLEYEWNVLKNGKLRDPGPLAEFVKEHLDRTIKYYQHKVDSAWMVKLNPSGSSNFYAQLDESQYFEVKDRKEAFEVAVDEFVRQRALSGRPTKKPYEVLVRKHKWAKDFSALLGFSEVYVVRLEIEKVKITKPKTKKR